MVSVTIACAHNWLCASSQRRAVDRSVVGLHRARLLRLVAWAGGRSFARAPAAHSSAPDAECRALFVRQGAKLGTVTVWVMLTALGEPDVNHWQFV